MSGSIPTTKNPSKIKIVSHYPTIISVSHSLKKQVRSRGGQRWMIEYEYPVLTRVQFSELFAFLLKQRGRYDTFTISPPTVATPQGGIPGSPIVQGANQTGRSVVTDGWGTTQSNVLVAGDFIKFANHSKVYMITANASSNGTGTGEATLSIEPALITSPADNSAITVSSVPFTVSLADDNLESEVSMPEFYNLKLGFIETM